MTNATPSLHLHVDSSPSRLIKASAKRPSMMSAGNVIMGRKLTLPWRAIEYPAASIYLKFYDFISHYTVGPPLDCNLL